jgi:hypothetical protein
MPVGFWDMVFDVYMPSYLQKCTSVSLASGEKKRKAILLGYNSR